MRDIETKDCHAGRPGIATPMDLLGILPVQSFDQVAYVMGLDQVHPIAGSGKPYCGDKHQVVFVKFA